MLLESKNAVIYGGKVGEVTRIFACEGGGYTSLAVPALVTNLGTEVCNA